jgi:hypothetical protein
MLLLPVVLTFAFVIQCYSVMPLQHVAGLMSPPTIGELRALASTRRFERHVRDSDDVYGGSTVATLRAKYVSHAQFASFCEERPNNFVQLTAGENGTVFNVGDVVFGNLCSICDARDEMSGHLCVARVAAVDATSGDVQLTKIEDAWRLVDSIDIEFVHTPGNRTHAEAMAEMRKRGNHVLASVADQSMQFGALDWNYDAAGKKAAAEIDIPELSTEFGVKSTCVACFAHLGAGVEFALRLSLNAYGTPIVDAFKLVVFGELALSSRFRTTWPIAAEQSYRFALLDRAIGSVPLVIPIGLLAVTIRPYTLVTLTATGSFSLPLELEYGARVSGKLRHGVQLVPGETVQRVQSMESDSDVYVKMEKPTLDALVTAGLEATLRLGVSLTVAAAALLPINPMINVTLSVRPEASLGLVPSETCALSTSYELKAGLKMAAEVSVFSLGIGKAHYDLSFNGRLPYRIDVDAVETKVPEGCALCSGCLPGAAALTNIVMKTIARILAPPPLPAVSPRTDALEVSVVETSAAIGAPLTIRWRRADDAGQLDIVKVTFAAELRRGADASVFDADWVTNEQLDATVAFDTLEFKIAQLGPLGVGLPAGTRVRFVVTASHSDDLFGRSDWLQLGAPVAAGAAPMRLFSGWEACNVECGTGGSQTRTTFCVAGDGAAEVDNSTCAYTGVLSRTCSSLLASCPYVPYKIAEPTTLTVESSAMWNGDLSDASVVVEFFGGQISSSTAVWGCPVNKDLDPCSTASRPTTRQCAQLTTVNVNAKGTTRIRVQLGSFVTRGRVLTVFTQAGPVPFVVMLENMSGAREWMMSSPIVLRPTLEYFLEFPERIGFVGTVYDSLRGPISLASPLGTVVLTGENGFKSRAKDIGAITAIAFYGLNGTDPGGPRHDFFIRTKVAGSISGKSYEVSDRRADKSEGWATSLCNGVNTARLCVVCNPGTSCMRPSDTLREFTNLLRSCPQPVENVQAWVAPPGWMPPATWTNGGDGVGGGGSSDAGGSGPALFTEGSFFASSSSVHGLTTLCAVIAIAIRI